MAETSEEMLMMVLLTIRSNLRCDQQGAAEPQKHRNNMHTKRLQMWFHIKRFKNKIILSSCFLITHVSIKNTEARTKYLQFDIYEINVLCDALVKLL